jgi:hypothetical protein
MGENVKKLIASCFKLIKFVKFVFGASEPDSVRCDHFLLLP